MYRKFTRVLEKWQENNEKNPLMVIGARQTGKTWIVRDFCRKTFGNYLYINLEENKALQAVFDGNIDPDSIIRAMEQILAVRIDPITPVFIDEIQVCERAITALKYFSEDKRNFRIICAGSLLGVKLHRFQGSFPVGKVHIVNLYPMDFEEFLLACGEDYLRDGIAEAYKSRKPLTQGAHEKALDIYHDYLFTGGMPAVVLDYLNHDKNIMYMDDSVQAGLRLAYLADMTKYVSSPQESVKIAETYQSVPRQLARDNPKFKYSEVRHGGSSRDFMLPLDWLTASGMVIRVNRVELPAAPLKGYEDEDNFKIYLSDVGMLTSLCQVRVRDMLPDAHNIYKGGIVENFVFQQLKANHPALGLYFFKPSQSMEIDAVFDDGEAVIPIEIKSGRHKRSTSLNNYREKYHPPYAIRLSENHFGFSGGICSVPLYAAFCI